jgi:hypothetical protein
MLTKETHRYLQGSSSSGDEGTAFALLVMKNTDTVVLSHQLTLPLNTPQKMGYGFWPRGLYGIEHVPVIQTEG